MLIWLFWTLPGTAHRVLGRNRTAEGAADPGPPALAVLADPNRDVGRFQGLVHDGGQIVPDRVQVHSIFQPRRESGYGLVGVIPATVDGSARVARHQSSPSSARRRNHLAGESVVPRVQRRKLAHQLQRASVAGEPVEQDPAGGPGVLGARPLPGRHILTAGQNHRSPRSLPADARHRRPVQRSYAAGHAASLPYELRDAREPPSERWQYSRWQPAGACRIG